MSGNDTVAVLRAEIEHSLAVLTRIEQFYEQQRPAPGEVESHTPERGIIIAEILANYYTALETIFLRISQYFENHLSTDRWHSDLLDRMLLSIPGVRPRVLSDPSHQALRELMRFRHFKRYYLEFDYDWDRLEFLCKKMDQVHAPVRTEIEAFLHLLAAL